MTKKPPQPGQLSPEMIRVLKVGAKWGAIIGAALGFIIVTGICFRFKLPIPPLAGSEVGILLGVGIGMPVAIICRTRAGRVTLACFVAGCLLGIPAAFWATGHFQPMVWASIAVLATFLGYQSGQIARPAPSDPWQLHH